MAKEMAFHGFKLSEAYTTQEGIEKLLGKEKDAEKKAVYTELYKKYGEQFAALYQIKNNMKTQKDDVSDIIVLEGKIPALALKNKQGSFIVVLKKNPKDGIVRGVVATDQKTADKMTPEYMKNFINELQKGGVDTATLRSNDEKLAKLLADVNTAKEYGILTPEKISTAQEKAEKIQGTKQLDVLETLKVMCDIIYKMNNKSLNHGYWIEEEGGGRSIKFGDKIKSGGNADYALYVMPREGGGCSFGYSVAKGGVNDEMLNVLVSSIQACEYNAVNIMMVDRNDTGKFISALTKRGIVVLGIHITPEMAKSFDEEAQKSLGIGNKQYRQYRLLLADTMEEYNRLHGLRKDKASNDMIAQLRAEPKPVPKEEKKKDDKSEEKPKKSPAKEDKNEKKSAGR